MASRQLQRNSAEFLTEGEGGIGRREPVHLDRGRAYIGVFVFAIGDHLAIDARQNRAYVFVVGADDRDAVERHARQERGERIAYRIDPVVVIEVFTIDVGDDRDCRFHLEE